MTRNPRSRRQSEALVHTLTDRDWLLLNLLTDHRVLTTSQVSEVWATRIRIVQKRLAVLWERQLVDRFRPFTGYGTGSTSYHWTLGTAGAAHIAGVRDSTPTGIGWTPHQTIRIATSSHLAHQVGANGVFTALIHHATLHPDTGLDLWWPPGTFVARYPAGVRPDGYGRWHDHTTSGAPVCLDIALEHDTGTEALARLTDKLDRYPALTNHLGHPPLVLFRFLTPGREHHARIALTDHPALRARQITAATTALPSPADRDPAGPIWRPLPSDEPTGARVRLADLPTIN